MRPSGSFERWLIIIAVMVAWETLPRAGIVPELFLPPLSKALWVGAVNWRLYAEHLTVTLSEVGIGVILACGGGIVIGAIVGGVRRLGDLLLPVISSMYACPIVMIYPIFTVWFGIGSESKIAFATALSILPVALTVASGVRTLDPQFLVVAKSMGATLPQQVIRVLIPASIPCVLTATRIGGALVIVGVVIGEMLTSTAGIGYLITASRMRLESAKVFAGIIVVLAIIYLFDLVMLLIEREAAVWRTAAGRPVESLS